MDRHAGPPPSAIFCPRRTRSPFFTIGVAGSPRCWSSGSRTSGGAGSVSIGRARRGLLVRLGMDAAPAEGVQRGRDVAPPLIR